MKSNLDKPAKIAILGGGLIGRLLAWHLANLTAQNQDTINNSADIDETKKIDNGIITNISELIKPNTIIQVFEQGSLAPKLHDSEKAAAFTAAAMISPLSELVASEAEIYQLGLTSLQLWPTWLKQLGCAQHFHQQGSLIVAHPNDLAELEQFKRDLSFKLDKLTPNALAASNSTLNNFESLSTRKQIYALEPDTSALFQSGLLLANEAHIDHYPVLESLVTKAKELGVSFNENCPIEIDNERLADFNFLFDCRGMGLKTNQPDDIRGVRGEVIRLECKEVSLKRPIRLMHPRYKIYVVPKPNHQFVIGATEIESEDKSPISLRSSMELLSALYAINPGFAEARIISQETNLRPAYINNLPKIETSTSCFGVPLIRINGLYRHGYLTAPALIELALAGKTFTTSKPQNKLKKQQKDNIKQAIMELSP